MKFSSGVLLALAAAGTCSSSAFQPVAFVPRATTTAASITSLRQSTVTSEDTEAAKKEREPTKKEERLRWMKNEQFHRKGFKEVRKEVEGRMEQEFNSEIVGELKESNYMIERDGVKVYLAKVRRA